MPSNTRSWQRLVDVRPDGYAHFTGQVDALFEVLHGAEALRRCLGGESLLDVHCDWRDEVLLLRDVRRVAAANGLAFETEVARAANCSSAETARFLRGLLDGG